MLQEPNKTGKCGAINKRITHVNFKLLIHFISNSTITNFFLFVRFPVLYFGVVNRAMPYSVKENTFDYIYTIHCIFCNFHRI